MSESCQNSKDGDGSIEVKAGGKSDRHEEREELGRRDFEDVQHRKRHRLMLRRFAAWTAEAAIPT